MPKDYRTYQGNIAPTFLSGPWGQAWMRALGGLKDIAVSGLKQAARADMPLLCPPDALSLIGQERSIIRGINETDASYAARVAGAWDAWQWGGTAFGILSQLQAAGYTNVLLAQSSGNGAIIFDPFNGGDFETFSLPWFIQKPTEWTQFDVLFEYPLNSNWLAGGLTAVFHGGTGTGVVTASGTPLVDHRYNIWITTGGAAGGGTAKFSYSLTNGEHIDASNIAVPNGNYVIPGTGITVNFSGTFTTNDVYSFAPTFNIPAENTGESAIIKSIVNTWKPVFAKVNRYIIHTSGVLYGWGETNYYGTGTAAGTPVYYGGSSATYWGP